MFTDLITQPEYHGIPLPPDGVPYIEHRLADALETIESIMQTNRRITVACMELRVPDHTRSTLAGIQMPRCMNS